MRERPSPRTSISRGLGVFLSYLSMNFVRGEDIEESLRVALKDRGSLSNFPRL